MLRNVINTNKWSKVCFSTDILSVLYFQMLSWFSGDFMSSFNTSYLFFYSTVQF